MTTPIRTRTRHPRIVRVPRLSAISDANLIGLAADARLAMSRCSAAEEAKLTSALAVLELECAARGLAFDAWTERSFPAVIRYRLMLAIGKSDAKEIGRLAGELASADLIEAYEEIATVEDDDMRFLGASAVCLALETHIAGWEAAADEAADYMAPKVELAERLRRVERRWGFLLGMLTAAGS